MTAERLSRRAARVGGAVLAAVVLLTGCGVDSEDADSAEDPSSTEQSSEATTDPTTDPTETESSMEEGDAPEPTTPDCGEVWVAGQSLPKRYDGCFDEEKERWVQAMVYRCSSGQHLVTYRRTFYAAKGERINETEVPLARDPEFTKAMAACGA